MLPVSRRVQPVVYTVMAISRYRDALLSLKPRNAPRVYPALLGDINTNAYDILLLPPRRFREDKPRPEDAYYAAALFLHARHLFPEIVAGHRGRGSLLLTPRLDAQNLFARIFADIGSGNLAHPRVLEKLQQTTMSLSQVSAPHVAALKTDLKVETLSHAAGLTAHTVVLLFGCSKFLGCHEQGHSRTVGLTRSRGVTILAGPPDRYGLIGMLQVLYCYYATGFASLWTAPTHPLPFIPRSEADLVMRWKFLESPTWALPPLAIRLTRHDRRGPTSEDLRLTILYNKVPHADLPYSEDRPMPYPKLLGSTRLHYYWSYVSVRTARPVAWLTHEGTGLRLYLQRGHQGVRSLVLPLEGDAPCKVRDFEIMLLPKLAFFALWDTPILCTSAPISEYLDDASVEDSSDGEDPGGPLPGTAELPTTSPAVPFVEIISATNPATIMSQDAEAPLVAVVLENFLGAAAALLRQRYQENLLLLVKQGIPENALAEALETYLPDFQVQLAAYIAAVVVSLFDVEILNNLPTSLQPFRQLADECKVHRALLRQINYLGEVGEHLQDSEYNVAWGLFHLRLLNNDRKAPCGFGLRLRSVTLYLPQPVAAAIKFPSLSNLPTLGEAHFPESAEAHPSFLLARWRHETTINVSPNFQQWYMTLSAPRGRSPRASADQFGAVGLLSGALAYFLAYRGMVHWGVYLMSCSIWPSGLCYDDRWRCHEP